MRQVKGWKGVGRARERTSSCVRAWGDSRLKRLAPGPHAQCSGEGRAVLCACVRGGGLCAQQHVKQTPVGVHVCTV